MAVPGFSSLFALWIGGGSATRAALPPPVLAAPSRDGAVTADLLARMLRRLPRSLWDTDPTSVTLHRDLYHAFASQMALWLEQREIAQTMTLLLEAQGVDLDTLLQDYGLRRYLQRPDPIARQIGMQILWYPQGTFYSIDHLADLLFPFPHVTLRTGRNHQHVFVAENHPVTTPYSYWGLVSDEGLWYAVTVDGTVPTISQAPPPGLDLSPGPHTLRWFVVQDDLGASWYVTIHGETLRLASTPPQGYGTTEPFAVLDGQGHRWRLAVRAGDTALEAVLETGLAGFGTWQIRDSAGTVHALWIDAHVPTVGTSPPAGSSDQTPAGTPLDWFMVLDDHGHPWYVSLEHLTLLVEPTRPGGTGTETLAEFLDVTGQRWVLTAQHGAEVLVATAVDPTTADLVVLEPEALFQAIQLRDSATTVWWLTIDAATLFVSPALPRGATDVTPAGGPFRWVRAYDLAGTLWYASVSTLGVLVLDTANPGGAGTAVPQQLGDLNGTLWHFGVDTAGNFAVSDAPALDFAGMATALCLTDTTGARWYWRVEGQVLEWAPVLWPDTLDQSPWGDLGWLVVLNTDGARRYVSPTPRGDPMATAGPPVSSPWGWPDPVTFRDAMGTQWHLTVLPDDRIGLHSEAPDDLPQPVPSLVLREALEAFAHIQAAGSALTLFVT